jgi:hypothetical protein
MNFLSYVIDYGPVAVTAAAAAMAVLPQGKPGSTWDSVRSGVNFLAMNFGNAKNARKL